MFTSDSPIDVVVDHVAAKVAKAWDQARADQTPVTDEEEAFFLAIAYRYLSERQAAVYKLERMQHLQDVQLRYRPPPSTDELYGALRNRALAALSMIFVGVLFAASLVSIAFVLTWVVQNIGGLLEGLARFVSGEALILVLSTALPLVISFIADHLFGRQLRYVFAGLGDLHWQMFQVQSSKQLDSERSQILTMVASSSGGESYEPSISDPDLSVATETPVPIQPGITEYVFSTKRVTIDDLGNDFRETKRQHTVVFWASFVTFILCLLVGLAAVLILKQDIRSIVGIGALSGVIGAFSYKMLGRARLARISMTLFDSYVIELRERMDDSICVDDVRERRKLRSVAWTNFRTGMNRLHTLEERSGSRKFP